MTATNRLGHNVNPQMVTLAREARGMSQGALAKLCGCSSAKLSRIETGLAVVGVELLDGLVRSLDFPAGFFFQTDTVYGGGVSEFYHYGRSQSSKGRAQ